MCIDFEKLDIEKIRRGINDLYPSAGNIDPVFGRKTAREQFWNNGLIKHGYLIRDTLLEIIKASPGWSGVAEFNFIKKDEFESTKERGAFIDAFVYNRRLNTALCIESKRVYDNVSGPYKGKILRDKFIMDIYGGRVMDAVGIVHPDRKIFFGIFDAYGSDHAKFNNHDIRIFRPIDLPKIFPTCAKQAFDAFQREVGDNVSSKDLFNKQYQENISDYKNFDDLKASSGSNPNDPEDCGSVTQKDLERFFTRS